MADPAQQKAITPWVDLIRVVAILLVVVIHVSGQLTNVWSQISTAQWLIADVYGGIARIGVPFFFMISGYLLLPRSESLRDFYAKRMPRVLIPFLVWSGIYLAWFCGGHPNTCTPGLVQQLLFVQGAYYHLWFLYVLISVYLILPVLRLLLRPGPDARLLWYLIGLWLIFQPLMTIAARLWDFHLNISAPLATGFTAYFVLGYLLGEVELSRRTLILSGALAALGLLATILGAYLLTAHAGAFDGFFYDFLSLNVILASAGAFVLLRWAGRSPGLASPRGHAVTRTLATAAFGIYLIHILVIEVLGYGLHLNSFMGSALWSVPLVSILAFGISFAIVRGLQQIPVIRLIVP